MQFSLVLIASILKTHNCQYHESMNTLSHAYSSLTTPQYWMSKQMVYLQVLEGTSALKRWCGHCFPCNQDTALHDN